MIVGNGMLAKAFQPFDDDLSDCVIFASGVSNSRETRKLEFDRECDLLNSYIGLDSVVVYFSTCSIYDPASVGSHYVRHKLHMERLVRNSSRYYIFRLPQVVGETSNKFTLANYLYGKISNLERFELWANSARNLIDVEHVALFVNYFIHKKIGTNEVINIACPFSVSVGDIVKCFEELLDRRAVYDLLGLGSDYQIDTDMVSRHSKELGVMFDDQYVSRTLSKYYPRHGGDGVG